MGKYFVVRDYWKHGNVDMSRLLGTFSTEQAARAFLADPANAWNRASESAYEDAADRVVHGDEIERDSAAVSMALASLESDDLAHATTAVLRGDATPARFPEVVQAYAEWERESHYDVTFDHDEREWARMAGTVAKGLALLAVAMGVKSHADLDALLQRPDVYSQSLLVQAVRQLHAEGVALPPAAAAYLRR